MSTDTTLTEAEMVEKRTEVKFKRLYIAICVQGLVITLLGITSSFHVIDINKNREQTHINAEEVEVTASTRHNIPVEQLRAKLIESILEVRIKNLEEGYKCPTT